MVPSVAPFAVAAATRSISPSTRKLAGRLLGCTCAAAFWLNGSVDELWAHERHSYDLKQHEGGPQEAAPTAQRVQRQAHTKRRQKTQRQVHQERGKLNQSAKQKSRAKTARDRRPETKNATKAARSKPIRLSRSKAIGGGNLKAAHAKSRTKTVEHRRADTKNATKAARSKSVRHSRAAASGRGNPKAAQAKSHTKTLENRRQQTKALAELVTNRSLPGTNIQLPAMGVIKQPVPPPIVGLGPRLASTGSNTTKPRSIISRQLGRLRRPQYPRPPRGQPGLRKSMPERRWSPIPHSPLDPCRKQPGAREGSRLPTLRSAQRI